MTQRQFRFRAKVHSTLLLSIKTIREHRFCHFNWNLVHLKCMPHTHSLWERNPTALLRTLLRFWATIYPFFLGRNYSRTSCRLIIILWWPCWGWYDTISTVVGEHPVCLNCVIVAKRLFLQYSFNDGSIMFEKIQNETLRAKDRLHRKLIMSCLELIPTLQS